MKSKIAMLARGFVNWGKKAIAARTVLHGRLFFAGCVGIFLIFVSRPLKAEIAYNFTSMPEAQALFGISSDGTSIVGQSQNTDGTNRSVLGLFYQVRQDGTLHRMGELQGPYGSTGFGAVNNSGQIIAWSHEPGMSINSFMTDTAEMSFTSWIEGIDVVHGMNDAGDIVGYNGWPGQGILRTGSAGLDEIVSFPETVGTWVHGVSNNRTVVGYASGQDGSIFGFVRDASGAYEAVAFPNASQTRVYAVNDLGYVAGYFIADGEMHGFVRDSRGVFKSVNYPGAKETCVSGISNAGSLVGYFIDQQGTTSGFYAQVPEPATLALLSVGAILVRKH